MTKKYLARLYTLIAVIILFYFPQAAFADSSTTVDISNNGANSQNNVHVQNSTGDNTICQNGNCTMTSGNGGQSTVCINGQCTTSSGDVATQSTDGNDHVTISNTASDNSVSVSPIPSSTPIPTIASVSASPSPTVTVSTVPAFTPNPTIAQIRQNIRKQIRTQIEALKQHIKDQDGTMSTLIQSFQHLFNGWFK